MRKQKKFDKLQKEIEKAFGCSVAFFSVLNDVASFAIKSNCHTRTYVYNHRDKRVLSCHVQ